MLALVHVERRLVDVHLDEAITGRIADEGHRRIAPIFREEVAGIVEKRCDKIDNVWRAWCGFGPALEAYDVVCTSLAPCRPPEHSRPEEESEQRHDEQAARPHAARISDGCSRNASTAMMLDYICALIVDDR